MNRILALAVLLAAPSLAMAATDTAKSHTLVAQEKAMHSTAVPAGQANGYELRAELRNHARAVETQQGSHTGYDPYATGVLTEPMNIPTNG